MFVGSVGFLYITNRHYYIILVLYDWDMDPWDGRATRPNFPRNARDPWRPDAIALLQQYVYRHYIAGTINSTVWSYTMAFLDEMQCNMICYLRAIVCVLYFSRHCYNKADDFFGIHADNGRTDSVGRSIHKLNGDANASEKLFGAKSGAGLI